MIRKAMRGIAASVAAVREYSRWSAASVVAALYTSRARAQETDLKGVAGRLADQFGALGTTIIVGAAVVGAGMVGWGLYKVFARKPGAQDSVGGALGMIAGGGLLVVLAAVIGIATQTTVGSNATGLDHLEGF